ncbi:MAG TPA: MFS transporter [Chloroflexota bacterium]|nr:MFS transporter [Chloroflexota bacterium]
MGLWRTLRPYLVVALLNASEGMITMLVPPYLDSQGFAPTAVGLLVSAYGVACLASRLPAGALYRGDRARALLASALVAVAIMSLVYPLATAHWSLLLVRAMHGLAYGLATTINLALFIDLLPPTAARHHAMGYFMAALGCGFTLGQAIGGFAADWYGYGWAFALAAAPPLLALGLVDAPPAAASGPTPRRTGMGGLRGGLRTGLRALAAPGIAPIALLGFFLAFFLNLSSTFMPLFALAIGLGLSEIGLLRSAHSVCNSITRPFSGSFIDRIGHTRIGAGSLAFNAVALTLLPTMTTMLSLSLLMIAIGLVRGIAMVANTVSLAADVDETRVSRGLATGIYYASRDLGGIAGPVAGGFVAGIAGIDAMFRVVPVLGLAAYVVGLALSARLRPRQATVPAGSVP